MVDPIGGVYSYAYSGTTSTDRLVSVTYPDSHVKTYLYGEAANVSASPAPGVSYTQSLTGIVDENSNRYASWTYDSQGRATSSEHGSFGSGIDKVSLAYGTMSGSGTVTTTVTDPTGTSRSYNFSTLLGVIKLTGITGPPCDGCNAALTYDTNGNIASRTDFNGNRINYAYDLARNLETSRTEGLTAAGGTTPQTRTISTTWHPIFRLPTVITEPGRRTNLDYDPTYGNLMLKTVTDTAGFGGTRMWSYNWNPLGQLHQIDGPRTDVSDLTTFTYYPVNDPTPGNRGNVHTITNALGHVTTITSYDGNGRPLMINSPDGTMTTLAYHPRGWLTSRNFMGEITSYDYDFAGQLTKVTLPDNSFLQYTYDAAHRLTQVNDNDNLGNKVVYTLDTMGNRTQEEVRDPVNVLAQKRTRVFDSLNHLFKDIGGVNPTTEVTQYGYDNQGNLTSVTDPLFHATTYGYDALNRLISQTAPGTTITRYGYNPLDQLTTVTDPRNNITSYTVSAVDGQSLQVVSPDTGTMVQTFDAAGNMLTSRDAKNQTTTYAYDALNRVSTITYQDNSSVTYGYDAGTFGIGRLTSVVENASGSLQVQSLYTYNSKGRLASESRLIGVQTFVTQYGYDSFGRLNLITYPSGRTVSRSYDAAGRIAGITTTPAGGSPQTLISNVTYHPFGGVKGFSYGNGQIFSRGRDLDGRINSFSLAAGSTVTLVIDDDGRITTSNYFPNTAQSVFYGYDNLERLTSTTTPSTNLGFGYDANGNRTTKTVGALTKTYSYPATSNKLDSISGGGSWTYTHDANGSITSDNTNSFTFNARGRLSGATTLVGAVTYQTDAMGRRYTKSVAGNTTVYHYDASGHLIAETNPAGATLAEYFYLGDIPVAVFK